MKRGKFKLSGEAKDTEFSLLGRNKEVRKSVSVRRFSGGNLAKSALGHVPCLPRFFLRVAKLQRDRGGALLRKHPGTSLSYFPRSECLLRHIEAILP